MPASVMILVMPENARLNLAWIAALSIAVAIEKLAPHGETVAMALGVGLIAAGAIRILS